MSLLRFLGFDQKTGSAPRRSSETATVRKIIEALESLEPSRAKFLAGFAYILGRVAHVDSGISPEETRRMERLVMEWGHLPEEQAVIVVQIAKAQNQLFGGTENYLVTREFNHIADREQKVELLHCLFAVSAADEEVSTVEENEIRKVADELGLSRQDYIAIKSSYRDRLEVLKDLP